MATNPQVMPPQRLGQYQAGAYNPFLSHGTAQEDVWRGLGTSAYANNQNWQDEFGNNADQYHQQEGNATNGVSQLLNPILNGGGGYTPDMQNNVLQQQGLQDVQGQLGQNYLTSNESAAIQGNPYGAFDLFAGQAPAISATAASGGVGLINAANQGNFDGQNIVHQLQSGYDRAIDPSQLGVSQGYQSALQGSLGTAQSALGNAQGDAGLQITPDYLRQAGMSDQEVQNLASAASRSVGAQYGATKDQLLQNAAASGTATPLGIASAMGALDRSSAADRVDAENQARLSARQAQMQAAQNVQNTQLSAGQYRAGLGSSNALALQGAQANAANQGEQMRLGAAQDISNRQMQSAQNVGSAALNNNQYQTGALLTASGKAADLNSNAAQYNATNATNLAQTAEQNAAQRAGQVASNRQGVNQSNQNTQLGINSDLSNRYNNAYQPWVNAQTQGLAAAQNQQQYYGNQANTQNQLRLGNQQTTNSALQGAAEGYSGIRQDNKNNSFGSKFTGALAGSLGAGLGKAATSFF